MHVDEGRNEARRLIPAVAVAVALGIAAACSSGTADPVPANQIIQLDRSPITFTGVPGTTNSESVFILDKGRTNLKVTGIRITLPDGGPQPGLSAGGAFSQPVVSVDAGGAPDPLPVSIAYAQNPGSVQFSFAPKVNGSYAAQLVIDNDSPDTPHLTAPIYACATDAGACSVCPDGGPNC